MQTKERLLLLRLIIKGFNRLEDVKVAFALILFFQEKSKMSHNGLKYNSKPTSIRLYNSMNVYIYELICEPDNPSAVATGHSCSVLLLSLLLWFHNTIVQLPINEPEEEQGRFPFHTQTFHLFYVNQCVTPHVQMNACKYPPAIFASHTFWIYWWRHSWESGRGNLFPWTRSCDWPHGL